MLISPVVSQQAALDRLSHGAPQYSSYKVLDTNKREIRLLDILSESKYCMYHASLDEGPSYNALSYYWGPPGANKPVTINDEVIHIRKTLFQFLKSLYRQFGRLTVWLDVICINQTVIEEQSAQVAMMGDIYRQAKCVYSWLGKGDPDTDYAMTFLTSGESLQLADEGRIRMIEAGIEQMFLRRYWTRVWIVQECVLNSETYVVCGSLTLHLSSLAQFMQEFAADAMSPRTRLRPLDRANPSDISQWLAHRRMEVIDNYRHRSNGAPEKPLLLELAANLAGLGCLDPRDRFYGFRALSRDGHGLRVDYHCSAFDIFIQLLSMHNWSLFIDWVRVEQKKIRAGPTGNSIGRWWTSEKCIPVEHARLTDTLLRAALVIAPRILLPATDMPRSLVSAPGDWLVLPMCQFDDSNLRRVVTDFEVDNTSKGSLVREFSNLCSGPEAPYAVQWTVTDSNSARHERLWFYLNLVVDISEADGTVLRAYLFPHFHKLYNLGGNVRGSTRARSADSRGHHASLEDSALAALLAAFRAVAKRHVRVCRITRGVHLSRPLLKFLASLQGTISGIDTSLLGTHGLEIDMAEPGLCKCTLPEGLTSPFPPPWGVQRS